LLIVRGTAIVRWMEPLANDEPGSIGGLKKETVEESLLYAGLTVERKHGSSHLPK
jgi:hypothetical protein